MMALSRQDGAAPAAGSDAKVGKILAGARRVFLEHGFGAATTDMIQQAAGVSKSTVYSYFPNKEALFVAVIRVECEKLLAQTRAERIEGRTVQETLTRIGTRLLQIVLEPSALALQRIVIAEAHRFPEVGHVFFSAGPVAHNREVAAYLAEADRRGDIHVDDPGTAALQFVGMVLIHIQLQCLLGVSSPPKAGQIRRIVSAAVDTFIRAHAARAS
jgi:TetR/AcrR family transcriptional regulator, mexJK operon transcriptional repressor